MSTTQATTTAPKKSNASSDIKRFTGYIAPDGTTHATKTAAATYTETLKIKNAATAFAGKFFPTPESDLDPNNIVFGDADELAKFLIDNRKDIQSIFDQQVRVRAPYAARKPKAPAASVAG